MAENALDWLFGGGAANDTAAALRAQAQALAVDYETLTGYKKKVDELLTKLKGSEAYDKKLADGTLPEGALGKGFAEAETLFKTYNTVHTQLENLSKGLAAQIEGLGIAILTSGKGFAGVDEDTQARMRAIARQAKKDYVADRDPLEQEKRKAQEQAQLPNGSNNNGGTDGGSV
ncbi:hypothetical protein ACFV2Q_35875 [Streptomyces sp. NPDC059650]|uniref:hypothetical protein n=1 Tax=Streptomyces sp. NPDC059650 TaxID=3346896 RepID=UPI0036BB930B